MMGTKLGYCYIVHNICDIQARYIEKIYYIYYIEHISVHYMSYVF